MVPTVKPQLSFGRYPKPVICACESSENITTTHRPASVASFDSDARERSVRRVTTQPLRSFDYVRLPDLRHKIFRVAEPEHATEGYPQTGSNRHVALRRQTGAVDMSEVDAAEMAHARAAWSKLRAVEQVTVTVIVDNESDGLSSPCACCDPSLDPSTSTPYQSEFTWGVQQVASGRWPCLDFRQSSLAGHGLSLLVAVTTADGAVSRVLFDGGPREDMWTSNAERLGVDMAGVGAAVLSHWHVDHSVGLLAVARAASAARSGTTGTSYTEAPPAASAGLAEAQLPPPPPPPVPEPFVFDLHPKRPDRRGLLLGTKPVPFNEDPTLEQLSLPGCKVHLHAGPHTLLGDRFFVSGAIPRLSSFETGQPGHATLGSDGEWHLDPHIMDERYLAVRVRGRGVVVFSGCSHAGIVNVVTHVAEVSSGEPIFGVMGGLHLASSKMEGRIPKTVQALQQLNPGRVFGGHCTGWRAKAALMAAFPDRFQPMSVGATYKFLAPTPGE